MRIFLLACYLDTYGYIEDLGWISGSDPDRVLPKAFPSFPNAVFDHPRPVA